MNEGNSVSESYRAPGIAWYSGLVRTRILALTLAMTACPSDLDKRRSRAADLAAADPKPRLTVRAKFMEPEGGGVLEYLGADLEPPDPSPGQTVTLTHYWHVVHAPRTEAEVLAFADVGGQTRASDSHAPLYGRLPTSDWRPKDVWTDRHALMLPGNAGAGTLELFVGLKSGTMRWTVEAAPGDQDGRDRLRIAKIAPNGAPRDDLPVAVVTRADGEISPDGRLDEADWKQATVLTFADSLGRPTPIRYATRLRLLYDDDYLYVGFESDDADITERYSKRDDPIYEHETVELFLMPNVAAPQTGPYVELQASPGGVIFDASFDGPRRGMNKEYDADQTVGTTIDGTLNQPDTDRGWVSEWRVPFNKIRGVERAPSPGDEWRMNAFRIEKHRVQNQAGAEYSAWSPPRVGDFHHVARFGRLRFGPVRLGPVDQP